ncbi:hypothetical protein KAT24_01085 [Candidatus Pacearchaeota archaeon]|nr:hypothetical protein [Candidatus Pacearchaeota archaeon]
MTKKLWIITGTLFLIILSLGFISSWYCNDGTYIPDSWRCDDYCDCAGCEDEDGCCTVTNTCLSKTCYNGDVWCYNNCGGRDHLYDDCTSSETCSSGACVSICTDTCSSLGYSCGWHDICGSYTYCGGCSSPTPYCHVSGTYCVRCLFDYHCPVAVEYQNDGCQKRTEACNSNVCGWTSWVNQAGICSTTNYCYGDGYYDGKECSGGTCSKGYGYTACGTIYQTGGDTYYCQRDARSCSGGACVNDGWSSINQGQICSQTNYCYGDGYYAGKKCSSGGGCSVAYGYTACGTIYQTGGDPYWCQQDTRSCKIVGTTGTCDNDGWSSINQGQICSQTNYCYGDGYYAGKKCSSGACSGYDYIECADASCFSDGDGTYSQKTDSTCPSTSCTPQTTSSCANGYACDGTASKADGNTCTTAGTCTSDNQCADTYVCSGGNCGLCGNGVINTGEVCDDGDTTDAGTCNADCSALTYCGDGTIQSPNGAGEAEVCDDGNDIATDTCNACALTYCGDNIIQNPNGAGEAEACDDGGTSNGDGCSAICEWETTAMWVDESGNQIDTKTVVIGGTGIDLLLKYSGLAPGTSVDFDIYENDPVIDDEIRVGTQAISGTVDSNYGGWAEVSWLVTQEDIEAMKDYVFGIATDTGPWQVYFKINGEQSNHLDITIVTQDYCLSVGSCGAYYDDGDVSAEDACNANTCEGAAEASVGETLPDGETCGQGGYECYCVWNATTGTCGGEWSYTGEGVCGDGTCDDSETCDTCPSDCGACPSECGDGTCDDSETCDTCPSDCGVCLDVCPDGTCGESEDCASCEADCGVCGDDTGVCGDGVCSADETCDTCPSDCGVCLDVCPDGICGEGEDCASCEADCGACPSVCGDGWCDASEDCSTCELDCGACATSGGGNCAITTTVTNTCEEEPVGLFTYSWTGVWTGSPGTAKDECEAGGEPVTIECPAQVQLPFFDFYNVIITLVLIGLVYVSLIFRRKKK